MKKNLSLIRDLTKNEKKNLKPKDKLTKVKPINPSEMDRDRLRKVNPLSKSEVKPLPKIDKLSEVDKLSKIKVKLRFQFSNSSEYIETTTVELSKEQLKSLPIPIKIRKETDSKTEDSISFTIKNTKSQQKTKSSKEEEQNKSKKESKKESKENIKSDLTPDFTFVYPFNLLNSNTKELIYTCNSNEVNKILNSLQQHSIYVIKQEVYSSANNTRKEILDYLKLNNISFNELIATDNSKKNYYCFN